MNFLKVALIVFVNIFFIDSKRVWAVVSTGPVGEEVSYLFIFVAVLGGIIAFMGIILTFRSVTSSAEVSIKVPNIGEFKFNKIGQGVILTIIGSIILICALYFYPINTTKTITKTTVTENENGTSTSHEVMAR